MGIDAPNRGVAGFEQAKVYLEKLIKEKPLTFEYDQYQDDKFGRILAYVWIDCFEEIKPLCHDSRALVNEVLLKKGLAEKVVYSKRKKLKYDSYLSSP